MKYLGRGATEWTVRGVVRASCWGNPVPGVLKLIAELVNKVVRGSIDPASARVSNGLYLVEGSIATAKRCRVSAKMYGSGIGYQYC
jgi:hypothetical protein